MTSAQPLERIPFSIRNVAKTVVASFRMAASTGRGLPLILLGISLPASLIEPAIARVGGALLDAVQRASRGGSGRAVVGLVALEAGLTMTAIVVGAFSTEVATRLRERLDFEMTGRVLHKAQSLSLASLDAPRTRDMISRARSVGCRVSGTVQDTLSLGQAVLALIAYLAAGRGISRTWLLLFAATAALRFTFGVREAARRHERERGRTARVREAWYLETVLTDAAVAPEVKIFSLGARLLSGWRKLLVEVRDERRRDALRNASFRGGASVLETCVLYALYGTFAVATARGAMSLGELAYSMVALRATKGAIGSILSGCQALHGNHLDLHEVWELLAMPDDEASGVATVGPRPDDGIRFEDVTFVYPGAARASLRRVSLHLPRGVRTVLLGANGSGKTTLLALLCGLYSPTSGRVLLDGLDLRAWDRETLRRRLSTMFQTFGKYEMSARENIELGDLARDSDERVVEEAAALGLANGVVDGLPGGYGARLGRQFHSACQLSGGQWQRVALARWFFRTRADVLVLDEPTSAMDLAAEAHVVDALGAIGPNRILVVASHRLEVMRLATRVVVLDEGCVVEDGAPEEVMRRGGHGARLLQVGTQRLSAA